MSQQNVDLVMTTFPPAGTDYTELFRDDEAWAAFKNGVDSLVDPDFKGAFVAWGQRVAELRGLDGLREAWIDWLAPRSSYYEQLEDAVAVGADRVVLLGREHGYRLDTESEVATDSAGVYLVRNGKIVGAEFYASQAEALEAVGLAE
jgi:ketosteroid isomerase-like protein